MVPENGLNLCLIPNEFTFTTNLPKPRSFILGRLMEGIAFHTQNTNGMWLKAEFRMQSSSTCFHLHVLCSSKPIKYISQHTDYSRQYGCHVYLFVVNLSIYIYKKCFICTYIFLLCWSAYVVSFLPTTFLLPISALLKHSGLYGFVYP